MLIQLSDHNGSPVYINPQHIIAVREEKHFGRPGVGTHSEYRDTLILTTKGEFNVQESPADVARQADAVMAMSDPDKPADAAVNTVPPPD